LWSFNEEEVLRAAADSKIPLISAIGHETDTTLLDHVADLRAPTPTGAAEKAVPVRSELLANINALARRHDEATFRLLDRRRGDLRALARALPQAENLLAIPRQRQDRAAERLSAALRSFVGARRLALAEASRLLARHAPQAELQRVTGRLNTIKFRLEAAGRSLAERRRERFATLGARFDAAFAGRVRLLGHELQGRRERVQNFSARLDGVFLASLARRRDRLAHAEKLLGAVGYEAVLKRGFALARDAEGGIIRSAKQLGPGDALNLHFADGKVAATVNGDAHPRKPAPAKKALPPGGQGSLF
jgi:exodeoxyribonuclease VII large subunit